MNDNVRTAGQDSFEPVLPPDAQPLPHAKIISKDKRVASAWWIIALLSVGASIASFAYAYRTSGPEIVIEFVEGHGIKPEDRLRHHGIDIGAVSKVELSNDLSRVLVSVRLQSNAAEIAREGSQFWIVRPALSFDNISGLDTILGAKYISVRPGQKNQNERVALPVGVGLHWLMRETEH